MSNHLAIAAVTATLQDRLLSCAAKEIPGATVVATRPDGNRQAEPGPGINVFLYEVVTNPFLNNDDLPTRSRDGTFVNRPLAALDLHYLLTFNGKDNSLEPQRLLGAVIVELTRRPFLAADEVRRSIETRSHLEGEDPAWQAEPIILTPLNLDLEELSRLWSVLMHQPYSLSLQYQATVILLQGDEPVTVSRPVSERNIHTSASMSPTVGGVR